MRMFVQSSGLYPALPGMDWVTTSMVLGLFLLLSLRVPVPHVRHRPRVSMVQFPLAGGICCQMLQSIPPSKSSAKTCAGGVGGKKFWARAALGSPVVTRATAAIHRTPPAPQDRRRRAAVLSLR